MHFEFSKHVLQLFLFSHSDSSKVLLSYKIKEFIREEISSFDCESFFLRSIFVFFNNDIAFSLLVVIKERESDIFDIKGR